MTYFYLPGFFEFFELNQKILDLIHFEPNLFYPNIQIKGIYGSFPNMLWNGGRVYIDRQISLTEVQDCLNYYNLRDIGIYFTLTNNLLTETHLYDTYCNSILDIAMKNTKLNRVIIQPGLLQDYLQNKYPELKFVYSTTSCERSIAKINDIVSNDLYDNFVLDYRDNKNWDLLDQIIYPFKTTLLLNAECNPNCVMRSIHYNNINLATLNFDISESNNYSCDYLNRNISFSELLKTNSSTIITTEELYNNYQKRGFDNFKIEGRMRPMHFALESYVYYLVKPEYQNHVRYLLLPLLYGGRKL